MNNLNSYIKIGIFVFISVFILTSYITGCVVSEEGGFFPDGIPADMLRPSGSPKPSSSKPSSPKPSSPKPTSPKPSPSTSGSPKPSATPSGSPTIKPSATPSSSPSITPKPISSPAKDINEQTPDEESTMVTDIPAGYDDQSSDTSK